MSFWITIASFVFGWFLMDVGKHLVNNADLHHPCIICLFKKLFK